MMLDKLEQLKAKDHWRSRRICYRRTGKFVKFNQETQISFSSNDYLGLSHHPRILKALHEAIDEFGMGSGGSALVSGYSIYHHEFEQAYAKWVGAEKSVLFSSGYLANMGVLQTLVQREATYLLDKEIHASLIDACRLTGANFKRYRHLNMLHLQQYLRSVSTINPTIVTESVFSMSGDQGITASLLNLQEAFQAQILIDDSHGFGILGNGAGGYSQIPNSLKEKCIVVVSLGKAFGLGGGVVSGSSLFIDALLQYARTYCYDTAIPPAWAKAGIYALEVMKSESWRREKIQDLIEHFQLEAKSRNFNIKNNQTHIQIIIVKNALEALRLAREAERSGFWLVAIRPPTVKASQCCLRVSLTCEHEREEITALLDSIYYASQSR